MDTKTALLDTAERCIRQVGYDGFSYADLAKDVGIRKASIHYHFPTKADLTEAVISRYRQNVMADFATISARDALAATWLKAYVAYYRAALSGGDWLCACVALSLSCEHLPAPVIAELNHMRRDNKAWLKTAFERGAGDGSIALCGDPDAEAHACLALVEGAQLTARTHQNLRAFDQAVALFVSRLS